MKRIIPAAAAGLAAVLLSCSSPHLAISSNGTESVPAGGQLLIQAQAQDSSGLILWKLSGPGFLLNIAGQQNIYYAPAEYDPAQTSATAKSAVAPPPPAPVQPAPAPLQPKPAPVQPPRSRP